MFYQRSRHTTAMPGLASPTISVRSLAQECSGERTRRRRKDQPVSVYSLAKMPSKGGTTTELGPLTIIPPGKRVSPLSPNFISETSLAVSPRFNWRQLEQQVNGTSEERLLAQLTALQLAVSQGAANTVRHIASEGLDLGLPLRGQTALALAISLGKAEMVRELLREMMKQKSVMRNINAYSVDNASRRETPLITASRTGQLDSVRHLASYGADLELRDGEGHSALWCAVREQREDMVSYLITRGAKVFYDNADISCPLQLACKTPLLKDSGKKIASLLVAHGANLEYQDIALRNTLFWVVYNNSRELAYFVIQCGARLKPWSWIDRENLPENMKQEKLLLISVCQIRRQLSKAAGGRSILPRVDKLRLDPDLKKVLKFESAHSRRKEDIMRLHRLQEETTV